MQEIEGQDIFAEDFERQEQSLRETEQPSEIQKFYEGSTVLVTGSTGFLGKILVEKLLRTCNLKKMFLIMRSKKGKTIEERLKEEFEEEIYSRLKREKPKFLNKVTIIPGDFMNTEMLSEEHRNLLIQEVDIIFHCAATVRFSEKLRQAFILNVRATKYLLSMAKEIKNLKVFVHCSTAYSNCVLKRTEEKIYVPKYNYKKLHDLLEILEDDVIEPIVPLILQKWPNTYTFTKMIAEYTLKEYGKGIPIAVFRPSIVISTFKEPIRSWINNLYGPQGIVHGAALGVLRTFLCDPDVIADMIPVDMCINAMLAFGWDVAQTKSNNFNFENLYWKDDSRDENANIEKNMANEDIPVLHYVSSGRNPINWKTFLRYNYEFGRESHTTLALWHSNLTLQKSKTLNFLSEIAWHWTPAVIVDSVRILFGRKPILWDTYKKINAMSNLLQYFTLKNFEFQEDNVIALWKKLSQRDKELFFFNIEDLSWEEYFSKYIRGLRVYVGKDDLSTIPEGMKKARRLKIYHYTLVTVVTCLLLWFLWWILTKLFF